MPFLRQGLEGFGQYVEALSLDGYLPSTRAKQASFQANKIADVKVPFEELVLLLAEDVLAQVDLNPATAILDVSEG